MPPEPQRHLLTLAPGLDLAFRLIPPTPPEGFLMGERGMGYAQEEPRHRVRLTRGFWMAETPVTQAHFAVWTRAAKIKQENHFKDKADHPAENLNWRQAVAYCQWLTRTHGERFPPGFALAALPTEAEWEYACRGGTATEYWNGDGAAALAEVGWFDGNAGGATHAVREKPANTFQLHDLHGNVWEWCHDVYRSEAYKTRADGICDPGAAERDGDYDVPPSDEDDRNRVLRGGSWLNAARGCRSAIRGGVGPGFRDGDQGFRVCLVPGPSTQTEQTDAAERHLERAAQAEGRSGAEGQEAGDGGGGPRGWLARAAAKFFPRK